MMKHLVAIVLLVAAAGTAACTGFQSGRSATSPTAAAPLAAGSTSGTLVARWVEPTAFAVPSASSCTNFQWEITSQSETAVAGTLSATCDGGIAISASATGMLLTPTTVAVTTTGVALVSGVPACTFSLSGTGTITDNNNTLTIPYTGTTCVGPVHGTQTLRRHVDPPPPAPAPPAPDPTAVPPAPIFSGPTDAISLSQAIILNSPRDLASWPITTTITAVAMGPNGVHVDFDKREGPGAWPAVFPPTWSEPLQYTLGMALNINGQWYASAVVQFWPGLPEGGGPPSHYATNWFYDPIRWAPMTYHQPAPGELIGFFVCEGDCRNNPNGNTSPLRERSNVVLVPMPANDNGGFQKEKKKGAGGGAPLPLGKKEKAFCSTATPPGGGEGGGGGGGGGKRGGEPAPPPPARGAPATAEKTTRGRRQKSDFRMHALMLRAGPQTPHEAYGSRSTQAKPR